LLRESAFRGLLKRLLAHYIATGPRTSYTPGL